MLKKLTSCISEKRKRFIITSSLLINIGFFIIFFTPISEWTHRLVMTGDEPQNSSVIVILSSVFPFRTEQGMLGLSTLTRLEKGFQLYRAGYAKDIIVLGGIEANKAGKTTGQIMKEHLTNYGVPEAAISVQDHFRGPQVYYDNIVQMIEDYGDRFDFERAMFVTSADNSYRMRKLLQKLLKSPRVVLSEQYELSPDWGRRFHQFRRVANEILVAIPEFYFRGRF
jgi:uncharacterized SAM-binding protein YcdF (DUF218 family)